VLAIELRFQRPLSPQVLVARVVHSTPNFDGNWLIGCSLRSHLSDHDLQAFLPGNPVAGSLALAH
jgi:hypothetical protein